MTAMQNTIGQFVKYEADQRYSRENVTVKSGQNLAAGTVVGRITASGKIAVYDNAAVDGTQTAVGVLIAAVDASAADMPGVIIARHAIVVDKTGLVWKAAMSEGDKDAGIVELKAAGIQARATV